MLRIEFEQNLAANEQTGPINKEMRNLITSLQTHNVQLKGEVARYKRKCKESAAESAKLRKELDDMKTAEIKALQAKKLQEQQQQKQQQQQQEQQQMKQEPQEVKAEAGETKDASEEVKTEDGVTAASEDSETAEAGSAGEVKKEEGDVKAEPGEEEAAATAAGEEPAAAANDEAQENAEENAKSVESDLNELKEKIDELTRGKGKDAETIKELKANLKKAQNDLKEMKLLLDMYKACTKEQREKAAIMVAEKKARAEAENLQQQLKKLGEAKKVTNVFEFEFNHNTRRKSYPMQKTEGLSVIFQFEFIPSQEEKKRLADEDATRRIKQLEEQCASLNKQLANHKQEEEALLSDMEVTGQAFEDMQEQNSRLIQQVGNVCDCTLQFKDEG